VIVIARGDMPENAEILDKQWREGLDPEDQLYGHHELIADEMIK
jgi:hypothetical protein